MKKIKLLASVTGLTTLATSSAMMFTSCSNSSIKELTVELVNPIKTVGTTLEPTDFVVSAVYSNGKTEVIDYAGSSSNNDGYTLTCTNYQEIRINHTFIQEEAGKTYELNFIYHGVTKTATIKVNEQVTPTPTTGGNLDQVYTPTVEAAAYKEYATVTDIQQAYLEAVENNNQIFIDDIMLTWSKGNIYYKSLWLLSFKIDKWYTNAQISNVVVDKTKKTITFDADIDLEFKFNDSVSSTTIELIGLNCRQIKGKSKVRYVLQLTTEADHSDEKAYTSKYFSTALDSEVLRYCNGICNFSFNFKSTLQVLEESANYIGLDYSEKSYEKQEGEKCLFVYGPTSDEVLKKISKNYLIADLACAGISYYDRDEYYGSWVINDYQLDGSSMAEAEIMSDELIGDKIAYRFGSNYFKNSNIVKDRLFAISTYVEPSSSTAGQFEDEYMVVSGFNRSLDTEHIEKLIGSESTLTMPDAIYEPGTGFGTNNSVSQYAFASYIESEYNPYFPTMPSSVKKVVIPDFYDQVSPGCFKNNRYIEEVVLPTNSNYTSIYSETFANCSSLKKINISKYIDDISMNSGWQEYTAFFGCNLEEIYLDPENTTYVPYGENSAGVCKEGIAFKLRDSSYVLLLATTKLTDLSKEVETSVNLSKIYTSFPSNSEIVNLYIPNNIKYVCSQAFNNLKNCTSICLHTNGTERTEDNELELYDQSIINMDNLTSVTGFSEYVQLNYGTFDFDKKITTLDFTEVNIDDLTDLDWASGAFENVCTYEEYATGTKVGTILFNNKYTLDEAQDYIYDDLGMPIWKEDTTTGWEVKIVE